MDEDSEAGPVAHILVVGFHHKKGCQVEFCYPPIFEEKGFECKDLPPQWKHLACLALPDGSHNYDKDTIYFLLPGMDDTKTSMFGIACYKQMRSNDLLKRSSEVTRGTVQKSVVVLSELPLFGLIDVKLQLITHAYFAERDFSKTSILKEFFNSMQTSLPRSMPEAGESQVFIGLSLVELVKKFKHRTLILFKLLLLERRVLFFGSPVHSLCRCLLSVISLFPEMIQGGLTDAACPRFYQVKSPKVSLEEFGIKSDDYFNIEMSNVPNYQHRPLKGEKSQTLPSFQRRDTQNERTKDEIKRYSDGDKNQRLLSRSYSCDSAIKSTNGSRSSQVSKVSKTISLSESPDDDDELLDMIDEELFGTYFEEKREKIARSLSRSDRMVQNGDLVESLQVEREDGASSPNEMSSLLSHDQNSTNERGDDQNWTLEDKDKMDQGTGIAHHSTANNNELSNGSKEIFLLDSDGGSEKRIVNIMNVTSEEIDDLTVAERTDKIARNGIVARDDAADKGSDSFRLDGDFSPDDQSTKGRTTDVDGRTTLESGIGSMGSRRWEDNPSPQTIDRRTDSDQRSSISDSFVVLSDLPPGHDTAVDDFGFPLSLFGKGSLFHPYMALQQHDLLQDVSVRCFVIGASNILFKHKRQILDVIVEIENGEVTILSQELRKQLSLTTADLRFSDYVVNTVLEHNGEDGTSNTGWEGGEEWIRAQFKLYLLSLLATCADNRPLAEQTVGDFNESYIAAWRTTHNYRVWKSGEHSGIDQVHTRHICHGQLSINDMKIRWNSAMQNSERGKNINNVINRTSVAVSNTGKAVGEAWTSAKSVMSTWLFGFGADDEDDRWSYEQE